MKYDAMISLIRIRSLFVWSHVCKSFVHKDMEKIECEHKIRFIQVLVLKWGEHNYSNAYCTRSYVCVCVYSGML